MAPVPLEGHQTPVMNNMPQEGARGGSISLGMLIDFIVQRTYHELTVLAELLPRKTDMERKIEIYNFSARTRQLFVRLLALVKWANSASKVDRSANIMAFLDKQSLLFVETADMLARIARETLVHARLPNFHIPAAVEVLTTGTYSRLPVCIRERIVPADPITAVERRTTLARLNQVIQHRLVTGNLLPQMRNLKIDSGRVTFHVKHEFEVSMTVMGDGPNIPWRLLDIRVLVEDKDTGEGKSLVHPLQVQYVHQVLQARLADNPTPLTEVYSCLHFFAQSLQLEVLYSQTLRLMRDRLDGHIHIDEYAAGRCLAISYWRELTSRDPRSELGYRLTVQVDSHDPYRPLTVVHVPTLGVKENEIADRAIRSETLSLERLLVHTIYVRTHSRLSDLKTELEALLKDVECTLRGTPAVLYVPILSPCQRAEQLLVSVDTHTGALRCSVPQYDVPFMSELQTSFNGDHIRLVPLINELRYWLTVRRFEKTLQPLPASPHERLPLLFPPDHPLAKLNPHRMYVKLHRHPNVILVVELAQKEHSPCEIDCTFYLTVVKPSSLEEEPHNTEEVAEQELPKMYLKVITFIEFDSFVMTHGPFTSVDDPEVSGKRKSAGPMKDGRRSKCPAYFLPELAHVVALCDERVPFVTLAQELTKRDIAHQGLQVEANATALVLRLVQLPPPPRCCQNSAGWLALLKRLLSVSIRMCTRTTRTWIVEYVFFGSPLTSSHPREQGMRRPLIFQYNLLSADQVSRTVDAMLNDWGQIVHLYGLVDELAEQLRNDKRGLFSMVTVKSYSYNRLLLAYGPEKGATVTVQWHSQAKSFTLVFGATGKCVAAHSIMREQLEAYLNRHCNLAQIVYLLHETYDPLVSISRLPSIPQLGVISSRPQIPVLTFTMIPQSPTLIRISYQNTYCLELRLRGGGLVTLRDGAYSRFDRVKVVEEFMPTQGLKSFLSKYSDETAVRRRSQSEDDNPPSPVTMQMEGGSFLGMHHRGPQSPAQRDGRRFHTPLTPPNTHSNPLTPASPHTTSIPQSNPSHQNYGSSPATSFSLASPPSLPPNLNPSPSPGVGLMVNSPSNPLQMPSPLQMPIASPGPCPSGMTMGHSPASSFMGQTGHMDGSPFPSSQSMTSPAASNWPGSPGVPRPSPARPGQSPGAPGHPALHSPDHKGDLSHQPRVLPSKIWAGAVPTTLTYEALDRLCRPAPAPITPHGLPGSNQPLSELSPLERFLGCIYMRRQMQRFIQNEEAVTKLSTVTSESGVVHFKVESLQCRVVLNPQHLQSLHIEVSSLPDHKDQWSQDEIQTMEKFFDTRVAVPPYKPNALLGFARMLNVPYCVLKDFVQIMRLDLVPDLVKLQQLKWGVQICLRVPPSASYIVPTGQAGVLVHRTRILFFLQLWRLGMPFSSPAEIVLPLVYDTNSKCTTIAERRDPGSSIAITAANHELKRFANECVRNVECTLFPAVQDLLMNLTLPSEASQVTSSPVQGGPPSAGGPIPPQMQSPAGMMHSPMGASGPAGMGGPQQAQAGYPMGMPVGQHPMMGPQ